MKKTFLLIFLLVIALLFSACSGGGSAPANADKSTSTTTTKETTTTTTKPITPKTPKRSTTTSTTSTTTTTTTIPAPDPASLTVTLTLDGQPSSIGQWSIDDGEWHPSGFTLDDIIPGDHTIDYRATSDYISPTDEEVTLLADDNVNIFRNYQSASNDPNLKYHNLKVFLHPDLASGLPAHELKSRIQQYANEINAIFSKQTIRRFIFDPAVDIILTETTPFSCSHSPPLPEDDYEIWLYAVLTDKPASGTYGGYMCTDMSGAAGGNLLYWDAIHDPSTIIDGSEELKQYWRQIDHVVHEFEHVFGAGKGEYYGLNIVEDMTGVDPIQNIHLYNNWINDPYWGEHLDYIYDPLTLNVWNINDRFNLDDKPIKLEDLRNQVSFANLTVETINGGNRNLETLYNNSLPDLSEVIIRTYDSTSSLLLNNSIARVWNVKSPPPYEVEELPVTINAFGDLSFYWLDYDFGPVGVFNNYRHLKLIKVYSPGYKDTVKWVSLYDAQEEKLLYGNDNFIISIYMDPI